MNRKTLGLITVISTLTALGACSSSDAVEDAVVVSVEELDETTDAVGDISDQSQIPDSPPVPETPPLPATPASPDAASSDTSSLNNSSQPEQLQDDALSDAGTESGSATSATGALGGLQLALPPSLLTTSGAQSATGASESSYDFPGIKSVVGFIQLSLAQMELDLAFIEQLLPEIRRYCGGLESGSVCQIPEGTFSFTFTREYVNGLIEQQTLAAQTFNQLFASIADDLGENPADFAEEFDDVFGAGAIAELQAMVGVSMPLPALAYSRVNRGVHAYLLEQADGGFSMRWNAAFSSILVTTVEQGGDGFNAESQTTTFDIARSDGGNISSLQVNVWKEAEGDFSRFTFQPMNDINNTIFLSIEAQERQGTSAASTASAEIRAGNSGGTSVSTESSIVNGEEQTQFIVEFFNALGVVVQRESCTRAGVAAHCGNVNDWVVSESGLSDAAGNYRANAAMLPDNVTAFVVVAAGVDPKLASSTTLCKGYILNEGNLSGNARCSVPADELGEVQVFAELYQGGEIIYQLLPTASVQPL